MAEQQKLIQIRVSGSAAERFDHIKDVSGESAKQVFMNALATYETLKELPKGAHVVIEKGDGTKERLIIP